ncbi:transcription antitermination factor NusB [Sulfurirhabdus autotrophica]|uniref:Transcription antitermination protein NusB n=1 Tax=Sulfurirhabdus autotrophica TaxID=1706046 RepID=A0A4R3Y042_9PROT|nr:transcription antitermination factor NusB [Sulfurirhabdus autotrophica]TCV85435.1 NusB antitermination factor [Sulfurirhabdus autotrophica]
MSTSKVKSGGPKKSRRLSREFVLKGLYQRELGGDAFELIEKHLQEDTDFKKADEVHFAALLKGVIAQAEALEAQISPLIDRPITELSPIERAILKLATYELVNHLEIPYRVVINEAVELAKSYGGTDGYKYVNGVMDKLAAKVRAVEVNANSSSQRPRGK